MKPITLLYRRLPRTVTRYRQLLLHECEVARVSLGLMAPSQPVVVDGQVLFKRGDVAVWFIFPEAWHDTGVVYDRQRRLKGYYCDILMPARRLSQGYELTDLFLDLWVFPDGRYVVLDREEFSEARENGWLSERLASRAEAELQTLIRNVETGEFPTAMVKKLGALPENAWDLLENLGEA